MIVTRILGDLVIPFPLISHATSSHWSHHNKYTPLLQHCGGITCKKWVQCSKQTLMHYKCAETAYFTNVYVYLSQPSRVQNKKMDNLSKREMS